MADDWLEEHELCSEAAQAAAKYLTKELADHSSEDSMLLVSGGSSLDALYWASSSLDVNTTNSVTLAQVDERYGPVGHPDSNWKTMTDKGIRPSMFNNSIETLQLGTTLSDVAVSYNRALTERLASTDFKLAIVGIGADGQIAGIRPMTNPDAFDIFLENDYVAGYQADDYERITVTARSLLLMDSIIVYACGGAKKDAIDKIDADLPLNEFPAQMLKRCKKVKIFYGMMGE